VGSASHHLDAAETHEEAARRHRAAAARYEERNDYEMAALEHRNVTIEESAAQLERDRAALIEQRRAAR
jgi:hypothetical protein